MRSQSLAMTSFEELLVPFTAAVDTAINLESTSNPRGSIVLSGGVKSMDLVFRHYFVHLSCFHYFEPSCNSISTSSKYYIDVTCLCSLSTVSSKYFTFLSQEMHNFFKYYAFIALFHDFAEGQRYPFRCEIMLHRCTEYTLDSRTKIFGV